LVVIAVSDHLCLHPRVVREAHALDAAGWNVVVLGAWADPDLAEQDRRLMEGVRWRFEPVLNAMQRGMGAKISRSLMELRRQFGIAIHQASGRVSEWQVDPVGWRLLAQFRRLEPGMVIAHSEAAIWALRRMGGARPPFAVDFERWFSEALSVSERRGGQLQLLWDLEKWALKHAAYCSCPSETMGEALQRMSGAAPLVTLYSAPSLKLRGDAAARVSDRVNREIPSLHWQSRSLGRGSGVEELLKALPLIQHEVEIHLRGPDMVEAREWIASRFPKGCRAHVFFHDELESDGELIGRLAEHDIGLSIEPRNLRGRDVAVTEQMLQYLLAGCAVVASDTKGQREVLGKAPGGVFLYDSGNPAAFAEALNRLIGSPRALQEARAAALAAAQSLFCWEQMEPRLLDRVASMMARYRAELSTPKLGTVDETSVVESGVKGEGVQGRADMGDEIAASINAMLKKAGPGSHGVEAAAKSRGAAEDGEQGEKGSVAGAKGGGGALIPASFDDVLEGALAQPVAEPVRLGENEAEEPEKVDPEDLGVLNPEDAPELGISLAPGQGAARVEVAGGGASGGGLAGGMGGWNLAPLPGVTWRHASSPGVLDFPGLDLRMRCRAKLTRFWRKGARDVLDAGSGNGYFAWLAYQSGARVVAMVGDTRETAAVREQLFGRHKASASRLRLEPRALESLAQEQRSFDEIICFDVLGRPERDGAVVREFYRLLRPGGVLHLCCPFRWHPETRRLAALDHKAGLEPRSGYTEHEYRQLLEPVGFNVDLMAGLESPGLCKVDEWIGGVKRSWGRRAAMLVLPVGIAAVKFSGLDPSRACSLYARGVRPAIRR